MPYSSFVVLALIIHFLINIDIFSKKSDFPAIKTYRIFAAVVALYFVTDILWGFLESAKLVTALYIDTALYFVGMGGIILSWTAFLVRYLRSDGWVSKIIRSIGVLFFATEAIILIINIFYPILFTVDENCNYVTYPARNAMLGVQFVFFVILFFYTLFTSKVIHGNINSRNLVIAVFSLILGVFIGLQFYYPNYPVYSAGILIGVILLNSYTVKNSKTKVQGELEAANTLAYTDSLTGVHSRHAYVEMEERVDKKIANNELTEFAVVVFDLNGLKHINDTLGHKSGDQYIVDAVALIKEYFGDEHLYRFGGDEFVALLDGEKYDKRLIIMKEFNNKVEKNLKEGNKPVVSCGMSDYNSEADNTFRAVFLRADRQMYERKQYLKKIA